MLVNLSVNMVNLRTLHEIDRSIISVIKDYAHKNNFPEFNELLKKLKVIDKNFDIGYDESNNVNFSDMINSQNKLRIDINNKLEEYNTSTDKKETYTQIDDLIINYITNFNSIQESIKNSQLSGSKTDTI
ncbi:MAG: hypothetical protein CMO19_03975 [Thaumarchaeota archaeon]|nr:hypothetical protein [Nitrososphaerota archaeon]